MVVRRRIDGGDRCTRDERDTILGNLPDFKNERPALQPLVESRGHILLLSPTFHPELAVVGIEYSWGMSKQKILREINDEVPKHLHQNMSHRCARHRY